MFSGADPSVPQEAWLEILDCACVGRATLQERLLLAVVNRKTSNLLYKCSIPVGNLVPGRHYNLALRLGKQSSDGTTSSQDASPRLLLSLFLHSFPTAELTRWKALSEESLTRMQPSVDTSTLPDLGPDAAAGVAAVWKLVSDASIAEDPPVPFSGGRLRTLIVLQLRPLNTLSPVGRLRCLSRTPVSRAFHDPSGSSCPHGHAPPSLLAPAPKQCSSYRTP